LLVAATQQWLNRSNCILQWSGEWGEVISRNDAVQASRDAAQGVHRGALILARRSKIIRRSAFGFRQS
jgi:hypothetical protein